MTILVQSVNHRKSADDSCWAFRSFSRTTNSPTLPVRGLAQGTKSACPSCWTSDSTICLRCCRDLQRYCYHMLYNCYHDSINFHNIPYKTCNCRCHDQRGMLFCALPWHAVSTAIPLQSPSLVLVKVVRPEAASTAGWERRSPRRNLHLDTFNELITAALTIWELFRDLWLSVSIQLLMISKDWSKPQQKHGKTVWSTQMQALYRHHGARQEKQHYWSGGMYPCLLGHSYTEPGSP